MIRSMFEDLHAKTPQVDRLGQLIRFEGSNWNWCYLEKHCGTANLPNSGATEAGAFRETHKYGYLGGIHFVNYIQNYLDIFVNGVKLANGEYTADNGSSIYFAEELLEEIPLGATCV